MSNRSLTAVEGLSVGHAQDRAARTGCTVVLGPFRAAVSVAGFATGTREFDVLSPTHLVPAVDALLLTGGSAFGLGAADGVVRWLEERGRGFATHVARVPIVPAAVLFDLAVGSAARRPDAAMGYDACEAASRVPVAEGVVGAGAGATVGKLLGPEAASPGGIGSWSEGALGYEVAALVAVNAVGDVLSATGEIIAGARRADGSFANSMSALRSNPAAPGSIPAHNTTLAVIATNAPLSRPALSALARQASNALARRIAPVNTPFDGDVVFALSTSTAVSELDPAVRLSLAVAAQNTLEIAIERAVTVSGGMESRRTES